MLGRTSTEERRDVAALEGISTLERKPKLEGIEVDWDIGVSITIGALNALESGAGATTESTGVLVDPLDCDDADTAVD